MSEVEIGIERFGNPLVLGELFSVVGGQRMNTGRKRRQQGNDGIRDDRSGLGRDMRHQGISGDALIERDQRLLMPGTDDQVALPITEAETIIGNGGTLINRDLVGDSAAPLTNPVALSASLLATQRTMQRTTGALVGIDALVDSLMADRGLPIGLEVTGDLFRAPCLDQFDIDDRPGFGSNARAILTGTHAGL